ncbi:MAG: carbon-nitrogen hydrolase family protein [Solirubrobacteraceae bacterium MAG38_C4-C5]|nr:carbon-nitrogen hydrolase family protein [Candidatus Siliceabacter maunaloa]
MSPRPPARSVRVAAVQLAGSDPDLARSEAGAVALLEQASEAGARIAVLPELALWPYFACGTPEVAAGWFETVPGPVTARFAALARRLGLAIVLPLPEREAATGHHFNAAAVIDGDGELASWQDAAGAVGTTARKLHLPAGSSPPPAFDEPAHFTAGRDIGAFVVEGVRLGCLVCYDRRVGACWEALEALDVGLVAVPIAARGGESDDEFLALLRRRAREHGVAVVSATKASPDVAGGQRIAHEGVSVVIGTDGAVLASRPRDAGPGIAVADLTLAGSPFLTIQEASAR